MLIGPAMELATGFLKGKVDEKKAIQEVRIKKIQSDSDWENTMADATKSSWKDEYLIIEMIARVKEGFQALQELPEFYQYLLYTGVLASFGVKGADALMKMKK